MVQPRAASVVPRTSRPTAIASPYSAITWAAHSGFSSAAVPRLMRLAPVSSAASSARVVADAAGELDVDAARPVLMTFLMTPCVVAAAEGGVEVDEVDPLGALARPVGGGVDGIAVAGLGAGLALGEADGLAVGDVDRGEQDERGGGVELVHGSSCGMAARATRTPHESARVSDAVVALRARRANCASSRMPASPDFSGWNWVADSGPFSTAARNALAVLAPR